MRYSYRGFVKDVGTLVMAWRLETFTAPILETSPRKTLAGAVLNPYASVDA